MKIEGNLIDIYEKAIYPAELVVTNGIIESIVRNNKQYDVFICPPLIDAHVHIESSMLIPSEFARLAVGCGTVAVVSDPHEIANVCGADGVRFMIENGKQTPMKFFFTAPSCVPATSFETSGSQLLAADIDRLFRTEELIALGEMMNFPGVINGNREVLEKLAVATKHNKPIDGHIPGVVGEDLKTYISHGIYTDHECYSLEEAKAKISLGMKIMIREGSAAKNFAELYSLIDSHPEMVMLCTDDSHPDDIIQLGHIDKIIRMGLTKNLNLFNLLRAASLNPIKHYHLQVGCLQVGDAADFIIIDSPDNFNTLQNFIQGEPVYSYGRTLFAPSVATPINNFNLTQHLNTDEISLVAPENAQIRVIQAYDGSLITGEFSSSPRIENGFAVSDPLRDILKIVVINRYKKQKPSVGFINGFGLKQGAIASTIAHDSHNIIAIGTDDTSIVNAINELISHKGGICCVNGIDFFTLELPYAGLMSGKDGNIVSSDYKSLNAIVSSLGCTLSSPFMTLSFMALLVIPTLKIGDKGLFDITKYDFQKLFI
ncbi:MAG TPA: adenine deaminase [Bacteroidales bacterium]|nr:adenine deaminase [Bacteroidales bacterium]